MLGWPSLLPLAVVALVLLATIDDRHVGKAADERQLIWTAVAIAETGQIGQAHGRDFTYIAPDGRAVSRFGMGMSLLEVPAAMLAPVVEAQIGPGTSQPLFLVVPLLLVLLAAALAGEAARRLGAGVGGVRAAVLLTGLGSPFGAYAATAFSEPLQGAALVAAYALALGSSATGEDRRAERLAAVAGCAASWAVLAKSSLVVVAPVVMLPLLAGAGSRQLVRRAGSAAIGLAPGMALWAWFEWTRFGRLFGSYPGEGFTHPVFDGAWRLLVGPNLGFLWFFPAAAIAAWAVARALARKAPGPALQFGPALLAPALLVAMAAGWWAWHGVWGWGPRLLMPAVPLLAAGAAVVMDGWPRVARRAFVVMSILINVPGLVQHSTPVAGYLSNLVWPQASEPSATSLASYARRAEPDGTYRVSPDHVLATVPQASQFIVFPWFFWSGCCADSGEAAALATPPWHEVRPDLVPAQLPMSETFLRGFTGQPRARFWGRGFMASTADAWYAAVFDEGLADQVVRLQQGGNGAAALPLAQRLARLAPFGSSDALVLESYRILGNRPAAAEYLSQLPYERRLYGGINVVLALFERDARNAGLARQILGSVAQQFPPNAPLHKALSSGLSAWPGDYQSMIGEPVRPAGR